jgi:hypothetical protein
VRRSPGIGFDQYPHQLRLQFLRHGDDLLDHLTGQILKILRHHDLQQLRLGRLGPARQALFEEERVSSARRLNSSTPS